MNKQWIISLTLLLLSSIAVHAFEGFDGPTWYDYRDTSLDINGRGTLDNPIVITTPEQLAQLSYIVNEENARLSTAAAYSGFPSATRDIRHQIFSMAYSLA